VGERPELGKLGALTQPRSPAFGPVAIVSAKEIPVLTGPTVILILKVAVVSVTAILATSLTCAALGKYRLHGRLNMVFFILTLIAVAGLEVVIRFVDPHLFDYFDDATRRMMTVHLSFSIPSTLLMPMMLFTGLRHWRGVHVGIGVVFLICWSGTFITGIFFLPHTGPQ
jgi:hypothetical protein